MREDLRWPRADADLGAYSDEPTEELPAVREPAAPDVHRRPERTPRRRRVRRPLVVVGVALGVLVGIYLADLVLSQGDVPRGISVAGVDVGGLSRTDAETELRDALRVRLNQSVRIRAGVAETTVDPDSAGLELNWHDTLDLAGTQSLNPITRITSFFTTREVGVISTVDHNALTAAIVGKSGEIARKRREGTIAFDGAGADRVRARAVWPKAGQHADIDGTVRAVAGGWPRVDPIVAPVVVDPVKATSTGVRVALRDYAEPAVAGPVVLRGKGANATLRPVDIARSLSFTATDGGSLRMKVDRAKLRRVAAPALAETERLGRNARIMFDTGTPTVRPGRGGIAVDWKRTLKGVSALLSKRTPNRSLPVQYTRKPAKVTLTEASKLGIREVIGEFSTGGFKTDSGENIRKVAGEVDGAVVLPGQTFSLNGYTGSRGAAQGYVEAGIISNGVPDRGIGGGISQFATTLYNAAYFAGLRDAGHQEHSYYISRYPPAREATVFQGAAGEIDLRFTNDAPTAVSIQAIASPSEITVKIWGTKRYRVESITGKRYAFVPPARRRGPASGCEPSSGAPGFTTSDTRVLYNIHTGAEVRRDTRHVTYDPQPKIVCG